jgi:RNA polymerase sigma factor (sigma-70 family)
VIAALMIPQPHESNRPDNPRRAQNARLLERLIGAHGSLLRRQAVNHSQRSPDAEDALQDAYALFIERYHGRLPALPYLMTTIKHSAWEIARRADRRRERSVEGMVNPERDLDPWGRFASPGDGTEALAERHEDTERWRAAMLSLKPDERRALLLLGAGLSYKEIGELSGWTWTKVNRCVAEGRAALRRKWAE